MTCFSVTFWSVHSWTFEVIEGPLSISKVQEGSMMQQAKTDAAFIWVEILSIILIAEVWNHISLFATLETSYHDLLCSGKLVDIISWKSSLGMFFSLLVEYSVKILSYKVGLFLIEKIKWVWNFCNTAMKICCLAFLLSIF